MANQYEADDQDAAIIKVNRIAYAVFETPDLDRQVDYYARVLGLRLIDNSARVAYLSGSVDHQTVELRSGDEPRCAALGFHVHPRTDLKDLVTQIEALGIKARRLSDAQPNIKDLVTFDDPNGTRVEVFAEHQTVGQAFPRSGVVPNKLGHVAHNVTDIHAVVKFYREILGFRVSDWMGDFFVFLRCGTDHHTINLVTGARSKMHHIAFELRDWGHIRDSSDLLASERIPLVWGPVRHGIGHNISTYHRNPDAQIVELFCELDRIDEATECFEPRPVHQEFPQKPKVWSDIGLAANMWGAPPPDGFLD
jgi:catechol 2,3-dioxygenase-like lactoylglutathione lyase family enzyme